MKDQDVTGPYRMAVRLEATIAKHKNFVEEKKRCLTISPDGINSALWSLKRTCKFLAADLSGHAHQGAPFQRGQMEADMLALMGAIGLRGSFGRDVAKACHATLQTNVSAEMRQARLRLHIDRN